MRRPALLLALPLLALAACGSSTSKQAIRDTIRSSLTTTSPDDCAPGRGQTEAFLRQSTFGSAALQRIYEQRCRANVRRLAATSVTVSHVEVDGDHAAATFAAHGGQYAFDRATVALRRDGGRWRLDRLTAVKLDRAAYDRQQVTLAAGPGTLSHDQAACFSRRLARVDDGTLQAAIVAARPGVFSDAFLICFVRPELRKGGLSLSQTRCVVLRLRRHPDTFMRDVFAATTASERTLRGGVASAAKACAAR